MVTDVNEHAQAVFPWIPCSPQEVLNVSDPYAIERAKLSSPHFSAQTREKIDEAHARRLGASRRCGWNKRGHAISHPPQVVLCAEGNVRVSVLGIVHRSYRRPQENSDQKE